MTTSLTSAKLHCHDCVSTTPPAVCDSPRTCYDALAATTVKASDHINGYKYKWHKVLFRKFRCRFQGTNENRNEHEDEELA
jgi:type II secretory pathway component PulC